MSFFKTFAALSIMVITALPAYAAVKVGDVAPDFTLLDMDGTETKLSDYSGNIVVLEWTNAQCPFVVKHYSTGNMQSIQADATGKEVIWLSINSSAEGKEGYVTAEQAKALFAEKGFKATNYLLDSEGTAGHLYGAKTTPHMFIIGQDGKIAYTGAIDDTPSADKADVATAQNYITPAYTALLAGKTPEITATSSYGCSVKYKK